MVKHGKTIKTLRNSSKNIQHFWHQPIEMGFLPYGIDLISIDIRFDRNIHILKPWKKPIKYGIDIES
jgi:hypothetical protein